MMLSVILTVCVVVHVAILFCTGNAEQLFIKLIDAENMPTMEKLVAKDIMARAKLLPKTLQNKKLNVRYRK